MNENWYSLQGLSNQTRFEIEAEVNSKIRLFLNPTRTKTNLVLLQKKLCRNFADPAFFRFIIIEKVSASCNHSNNFPSFPSLLTRLPTSQILSSNTVTLCFTNSHLVTRTWSLSSGKENCGYFVWMMRSMWYSRLWICCRKICICFCWQKTVTIRNHSSHNLFLIPRSVVLWPG